jgi:uncharacterized OsmC-like protein
VSTTTTTQPTTAAMQGHDRRPVEAAPTAEAAGTTETPAAGTRNGVDVPALFATLDALAGQPELASFRFRAANRWITGAHSQSRSQGFDGAGGSHEHQRSFVFDADHPAALLGADEGPTPVEYLLYAISACITGGIASVAAARGITLTRVESTVEGDIDLQGILGLSDEVRNGYQRIALRFTVEGDASPETLRGLVERSRARSAVYDVLTNGVPVDVEVVA